MVIVFQVTRGLPRAFSERMFPRLAAMIVLGVAMIALLVTTVGMHWVIQERQLWLEP